MLIVDTWISDSRPTGLAVEWTITSSQFSSGNGNFYRGVLVFLLLIICDYSTELKVKEKGEREGRKGGGGREGERGTGREKGGGKRWERVKRVGRGKDQDKRRFQIII